MDDPVERGPVTLAAMRRDLASEVLSLERGLLHTFVRIWRAPGEVTRRYVEDRDPAIVRPLRYLLITVAAYSAIVWLVLDRLGLGARLALTASQSAQLGFVTQNAGWIVLLVIPAAALVLWAFDTRRGGAAAVAHAAYTLAQTLWAQCLVALPVSLLRIGWLAIALSLVLAAWIMWALSRYYAPVTWRAWLAAALALVVATVCNQLAIVAALRLFGPA